MCRPFNRKSADDDNKMESIFLRNPKDLFEERVIQKNNQYGIKYISINLESTIIFHILHRLCFLKYSYSTLSTDFVQTNHLTGKDY